MCKERNVHTKNAKIWEVHEAEDGWEKSKVSECLELMLLTLQ